MLKKTTAVLLISAFTHVYAVTPGLQANALTSEVDNTFNELSYKLNVEWDQKDGKFLNQSIAEFENEIAALQKEGLTNQDLVDHALTKIKDKRVLNDVRQIVNEVQENQMTPDEARAFVISKLNSIYSHGASWSGAASIAAVSIAAIAAIVCVVIWTHTTHKQKSDLNVTFPQATQLP
ncbi:MAG: hypothetical protein ACXVLQ_02200 [Bacteriovorax sp.]